MVELTPEPVLHGTRSGLPGPCRGPLCVQIATLIFVAAHIQLLAKANVNSFRSESTKHY